MKYLKMLGLGTAAAVLVALAGSSAASATVICKNSANTNSCSEPYEVGAKGTASLAAGTSAILKTTGGNTIATCGESVVKSTLANPGSATTTVESGLSSITWGSCNQTVDTTNGGSAKLHWISGTDNGTLITVGTKVTINTFGTTCTYGAGEGTDVGTTMGGNPGTLTINTVFNKVEGNFLCPSSGVFSGQYVATEPTNAWVAAG